MLESAHVIRNQTTHRACRAQSVPYVATTMCLGPSTSDPAMKHICKRHLEVVPSGLAVYNGSAQDRQDHKGWLTGTHLLKSTSGYSQKSMLLRPPPLSRVQTILLVAVVEVRLYQRDQMRPAEYEPV
jgi:hypothetical protein